VNNVSSLAITLVCIVGGLMNWFRWKDEKRTPTQQKIGFLFFVLNMSLAALNLLVAGAGL
jgi:formate hydrogenlyase subunit 3/multisubunit Na+/H+ antiporter MnhD subunit